DGPAPSPDGFVAAERDPAARAAYEVRVAALRGAPVRLEIPTGRTRPEVADGRGTRLTVELDTAQRDAAGRVAAACGVTRNAALLAAWALVLSRRTGVADLLVGVPGVGRLGERSRAAVGLGSTLVPVRCRVGGTVTGYVTGIAAALGEALDGGRVPVEQLAAALGAAGDPARNPLVQVGFAAHDELVPDRVEGGGLALELHEGHCGGTVFDAILFVQRWGDRPRLALEYAPAALGPAEATGLAAELGAALTGLAAGLAGPVAAVPALSPAQARRLEAWGRGGPARTEAGLWQLVEQVCARAPDAVAVRDAAGSLPYGQLRRAVERQATALVAAGVRPGDRVALTLERSVAEVVAVLAVLRTGAAYVGVQAGLPAAVRAEVLRVARPAAVLTDPDRVGELPGVPVLVARPDGGGAPAGPPAPAAPADPDRPAYVGFTSGSTGLPKGVEVVHRGVVRMAVAPPYLRPGATDRWLRLAPLAFDASTLELFVPLAAGGTVEVYPPRPVVPAELAAFLAEREVTGAWLTAGLFRLVADDRPAAFRPLRHLLTGGDVVPPDQVRRVLAACPGLLVSNGYGPTENTTFTTVHHVRDPADVVDPLPIGRPVPGTDVVVTDETGVLLPPGAVGELGALGPGLATGYLDAPAETARAFVTGPDGRRRYRTGDLVRWDETGRLRYLGRRDRQVKVRGYRIELDAVTAVLRGHPAVRDAVVAVTPDPADQRLVAGIVSGDARAGLVPALRAYAGERLAPQEVPALWAVVDRLPVTGNGKVDVRRLVELARGPEPAPGPAPEQDEEEPTEVEEVIAAAWAAVLGT
ncbi:MAG TPA: amino acid adenylation domain-containing protein, partial [Mycobacteriales bacterium]|nr:amino acid adenylation domain-containing protein [Mycobacteriales bacterium]